MSEFFKNEKEEKEFLPPDYSDCKSEVSFDSDDDDDCLDFDDDELEDGVEIINEKPKENNMAAGFGTPYEITPRPDTSVNPPQAWKTWSIGGNNDSGSGNDFWDNQRSSERQGWWNTQKVNTGDPNSKMIDRSKKVVFIDFFDGLVETRMSQGHPGLIPQGVFDVVPKWTVWDKLKAMSPEYVFAIVHKNILNDINGIEGWPVVLDGWCCSVSSYLRKPYGNMQILLSSDLYQSKECIIKQVLKNFDKKDCVYIGIESGFANQSDNDLKIARNCEIDYIDLGQLLTIMY